MSPLASGHSKHFTILPNIHPFTLKFTHRRRSQPRRATASWSAAVRVRRLAQGHLHTQLGGAGDRTSNLPVTSQPAPPREPHGLRQSRACHGTHSPPPRLTGGVPRLRPCHQPVLVARPRAEGGGGVQVGEGGCGRGELAHRGGLAGARHPALYQPPGGGGNKVKCTINTSRLCFLKAFPVSLIKMCNLLEQIWGKYFLQKVSTHRLPLLCLCFIIFVLVFYILFQLI